MHRTRCIYRLELAFVNNKFDTGKDVSKFLVTNKLYTRHDVSTERDLVLWRSVTNKLYIRPFVSTDRNLALWLKCSTPDQMCLQPGTSLEMKNVLQQTRCVCRQKLAIETNHFYTGQDVSTDTNLHLRQKCIHYRFWKDVYRNSSELKQERGSRWIVNTCWTRPYG